MQICTYLNSFIQKKENKRKRKEKKRKEAIVLQMVI
jgi:hypothetical protein